MMNFFRRYQKTLFVIISVFTISSFSFFGSFNSQFNEPKIVDRPIGKAVDGSIIMEQQLQNMVRFLSVSNDPVLAQELIASGIAPLLAERYFEDIKSDLQLRLQRAKNYHGYTHPQVPFISAEHVWGQFNPQILRHLQELKNTELSPRAFSLLCLLCMDQAAFSSEMLYRVLAYQMQSRQQDPNLLPRNLELFGYQNLGDWFGPRFMEHMSRLIINAAKIAKTRGYHITTDEARFELLQSVAHLTHASGRNNTAEALRYYLAAYGIDEEAALEIWKQLVLFRRLFTDLSMGVVVDPLTYEQFSAYANEKIKVTLFQLPESLRITDIRSYLLFQFYLDSMVPKVRLVDGRILQEAIYVEDVKRRIPELVQNKFRLSVGKVSLQEVCDQISVKATREWQMQDRGWESLQEAFPQLRLVNTQGREERFAALAQLNADLKLKVDCYARRCMVQEQPQLWQEALQQAEVKELWVGIRCRGGIAPFQEIKETGELLAALQTADIARSIEFIAPENAAFYSISVLEKPQGMEIVSFAEAKQDGLLDALLDLHLQNVYPEIRRQEPALFREAGGAYKPFAQVSDQVGLVLYGDVLRKVGSGSLEEMAVHYFSKYMQEAITNIQKMGVASPFLQSASDCFRNQFILTMQDVDLMRSEIHSLDKEAAFSLPVGSWSPLLQKEASGDLSFFHILSRELAQTAVTEQMQEGQRILSLDAKRFLTKQILDQMVQCEQGDGAGKIF